MSLPAALSERLQILSSALRTGHDFVPVLITAAQACVAEVSRLLKPSAT